MINIVITGSKGKMGSRIINLIKAADDLKLIAEIDKGDDLGKVIDQAHVVIDFTVADAAAQYAAIAARHSKSIVIGTTGLDKDQEKIILDAALKVPVVWAPNMSVGVNVMFKLVETAARALGADYKIDIEETHHIHKLDKPSGTAKKILELALKAKGVDANRDVHIVSFRRGEVVGDHEIKFTGAGETLSIKHHAATRDVFASGAITAARWIVGKKPGLYGMNDVLNFK